MSSSITPTPTSSSERVLQSVLLVLVLTGAVTNLLLLTAGLRSPQVRDIPFHTLKYAMFASYLLMQATVAVGTATSLHTGEAPDARPATCQVQAALTLFGAVSALCCLAAVAISRYLVIVQHRQLTRKHYTCMAAVSALLASSNVICLVLNPALASSNRGRLICIVQWADIGDSQQMYITISNLILWTAAMAVSFACYQGCSRYVKECNQTFAEWRTAPELLQVHRLFYLTLAASIVCGLVVAAGIYSAITRKPVPPTVDQLVTLGVATFYQAHSLIVLWVNLSMRNAVVAFLWCRRRSTVQPSTAPAQPSTLLRQRSRMSLTVAELNAIQTPATSSDVSESAPRPKPRPHRITLTSDRLAAYRELTVVTTPARLRRYNSQHDLSTPPKNPSPLRLGKPAWMQRLSIVQTADPTCHTLTVPAQPLYSRPPVSPSTVTSANLQGMT